MRKTDVAPEVIVSGGRTCEFNCRAVIATELLVRMLGDKLVRRARGRAARNKQLQKARVEDVRRRRRLASVNVNSGLKVSK